MKTQGFCGQNSTVARIVDKRRNWEARVEMAVLKRPANELSTYDKLVYSILCGHANRDGNAMLYVKTIADEASCSERQVQRAFVNLEARHLLVRRSQVMPGRGRTFNVYEVYGFDEYVMGDCQSPSEVPDSQNQTTDNHHRGDSQSEPNNVFQRLFINSKKEHLPPTPQGGEEGGRKIETSKPERQKHNTEEKGKEQMPNTQGLSVTDVLAAFNEILPELPKAEALTPSRSQALKLRMGEDEARLSLDWWRRYFRRVRLFSWLMGNNPNNWKATLDWLIGEEGMRKVIDGAFTQAPQAIQEYSHEELREWQRRYTDERGVTRLESKSG